MCSCFSVGAARFGLRALFASRMLLRDGPRRFAFPPRQFRLALLFASSRRLKRRPGRAFYGLRPALGETGGAAPLLVLSPRALHGRALWTAAAPRRFAFPQTAPRNAVTSHSRGPFVFPIALFFAGAFWWHRLSSLCALACVAAGRPFPPTRQPLSSRPAMAGRFAFCLCLL